MDNKKKESVLKILAVKIKNKTRITEVCFDKLEEIRLRVGCPLIYYENGREYITDCMIDRRILSEVMEYVTSYSQYAYENEMRQGFVTVEGGHRIGICGKVICEEGKIKNVQYVSSINIRIGHEIKGCADPLFPGILERGNPVHTLIISPPGRGKTTLLRDLIRQISEGNRYLNGRTVGVIDERSEIAACYMGHPYNHLGLRTDVFDGCSKEEGIRMMIRSMGPRVIAVDELGGEKDMKSVRQAMTSGVIVFATIHGRLLEDGRFGTFQENNHENKIFKRYIVMADEGPKGAIKNIYDERGRVI